MNYCELVRYTQLEIQRLSCTKKLVLGTGSKDFDFQIQIRLRFSIVNSVNMLKIFPQTTRIFNLELVENKLTKPNQT